MPHRSLSVVVTTYNVEHKLERQIHDMVEWLGESFDELDVLIVNDASLDETASVANALAREFPQIRVIHRPMRYGETSAITCACRFARGDTLAAYNATESSEQFHIRHLVFVDEPAASMQARLHAPLGYPRRAGSADATRLDRGSGPTAARGPHQRPGAPLGQTAQRDAFFAMEASLYDPLRDTLRGPMLID